MNHHCEDMAEGESATFSILSLFITSITKFVIQIYPLLYPQMTRSYENTTSLTEVIYSVESFACVGRSSIELIFCSARVIRLKRKSSLFME